MTERVRPNVLDPAAFLAGDIAIEMNSLQRDVHSGKVLQALQNDADRLRRASEQPKGAQFTALVQKNLEALAKNCGLPDVEISRSNGAIQFDMRAHHTDMPSSGEQKPIAKVEIYQARFTTGKPVAVDHRTQIVSSPVYPKNDSSSDRHAKRQSDG